MSRIIQFFQNQATNATSNSAATHTGVYGSDTDVKVKASIVGTGTVSATVAFYGNDMQTNVGGVLLSTLSLTGSGSNAGGSTVAKWPYMYCILSAITGAGALVTATMSE